MQQQTSLTYRLLSALFAFVMWAAWAYWANSGAAEGTRLLSAFVQGSASFVITLIMIRGITAFLKVIKPLPFSYFLPAILTVTCTGSCLIVIHYLAGTPNILITVSAPLTVALLFCLFTNYKIVKETAI